ncbi:hypothetical protein A8950_2106 [Dongia mobilis]|uniref:Uncharacterized protein n=1 Tax=Dongia mobilis TaxID=578943 RepID=A0A4R6WT77_9PROT|nr:hypothetical protein [Dongia mobilis]TDQ82284.1 hypothetical protein A8950_2106 [Dongia mobilis]
MSRRSIPEIRAAEARQAEMVRELANNLKAERQHRRQQPGGLLDFLSALTPQRVAAEIGGDASGFRRP